MAIPKARNRLALAAVGVLSAGVFAGGVFVASSAATDPNCVQASPDGFSVHCSTTLPAQAGQTKTVSLKVNGVERARQTITIPDISGATVTLDLAGAGTHPTAGMAMCPDTTTAGGIVISSPSATLEPISVVVQAQGAGTTLNAPGESLLTAQTVEATVC